MSLSSSLSTSLSRLDGRSVAVYGTAGAVTAVCLYKLYRLYRLYKPNADDPPCPGSYPIVGSFRHLGQPPLYRFIAEEFGDEDVVLLFLGSSRMYVLNSWRSFKEAMVDNAEALSGRISQKAVAHAFGDRGGLVSSDGDIWREYRRFSLQTLRDFGLGRSGAESCISREALELCRELSAADGRAIDVTLALSRSVSNVVCQLVFGSRLASENEEFGNVLNAFFRITGDSAFQEMNFRSLAYMPVTERFDFVLKITAQLPAAQKFLKLIRFLMGFCNSQVEKHAADLTDSAEAKDYIDAHLRHQQRHPDMFNNTRLILAIFDLFLAGTETTTTTLRWALLFMLANPNAAEKVRSEISSVIGQSRQPSMSDRQHMHYTLATIEEINRLASLAVLGVTHRTLSDVKVCGYTLPKDSYVCFNMYHIHRDPNHFEQPHEFRPERHLDSDGHFRPSQRIAPFGAGKRACLGESLARAELFIFFCTIMQRLRFCLEPSETRSPEQLLNTRETRLASLIRHLPDHKLVFTEAD